MFHFDKRKIMKELEAWVARDENGMLYLYLAKPKKYKSKWYPNIRSDYFEIDRKCFPEVKWEDEEPTEIEISIRNNMEKSKIKSALSFLGRIALFVFILWCTVIGILHVIQWLIWQTLQ